MSKNGNKNTIGATRVWTEAEVQANAKRKRDAVIASVALTLAVLVASMFAVSENPWVGALAVGLLGVAGTFFFGARGSANKGFEDVDDTEDKA